MRGYRPFNVNDNVRVKLTNAGRLIHRQQFDAFNLKMEYHPPIEDKDGWSVWQMHDLMNAFGNYMYQGRVELPFETNIEVMIEPGESNAQ